MTKKWNEYFELDPDGKTGLIWKPRNELLFPHPRFARNLNSRFAGKPAGAKNKAKGSIYWMVKVNQQCFSVHRIVFEMFSKSKIPKGMEIDHKDGNGQNNNPNNLRLATRSQNCHNQGIRKTNTSGYKGVVKTRAGWVAQIMKNKKHFQSKSFTSPEEAYEKYKEMVVFHHGEYAKIK
jgi:hypothetical protein